MNVRVRAGKDGERRWMVGDGFRHFLILQTGLNSSNNDCMFIGTYCAYVHHHFFLIRICRRLFWLECTWFVREILSPGHIYPRFVQFCPRKNQEHSIDVNDFILFIKRNIVLFYYSCSSLIFFTFLITSFFYFIL